MKLTFQQQHPYTAWRCVERPEFEIHGYRDPNGRERFIVDHYRIQIADRPSFRGATAICRNIAKEG